MYTRRRKTTRKHNTICVVHHYAHTNTNNGIKKYGINLHTNNVLFVSALLIILAMAFSLSRRYKVKRKKSH